MAATTIVRPLLNVFMYHRILPQPSPDGVSVKMFERQLDYLQTHYVILDADHLLKFLEGTFAPPKPAAVITFDDGWLDNWLFATPILKTKHIPVLLALTTGFTHDGSVRHDLSDPTARLKSAEAFSNALYEQRYDAFLSWAELKAMQASGLWHIQAHGHTHAMHYHKIDARQWYPKHNHWSLRHALGGGQPVAGVPTSQLVSDLACRQQRLAPDLWQQLKTAPAAAHKICAAHPSPLECTETVAQFRERIAHDLYTCASLIEEKLGQRPDFLFWPWGHYSATSLQIAKECGFRYTFTTEKGYISLPLSNNVLPRIGVSENWGKFLRNTIVQRSPCWSWLRQQLGHTESGFRSEA